MDMSTRAEDDEAKQPPPKRGKTEASTGCVDNGSDEPKVGGGADNADMGMLLPPDLWGVVLSFCPFDDGIKQCTAVNHYFLREVEPHVMIHSSRGGKSKDTKRDVKFALKVIATPHLTFLYDAKSAYATAQAQARHLANRLAGRFRRVKKAVIAEYLWTCPETKDVEWFWVTSGLLLGVLEDLVPNVTDLTICGLGSGRHGTSTDMKLAFDSVKDRLEKLSLISAGASERGYESCHYSLAVSLELITRLTNLTGLHLELSESMLVDESHDDDDVSALGLSLGTLRSLPKLRELILTEGEELDSCFAMNTRFVSGHLLGCAQIKSLKVLRSDFFYHWPNFASFPGDFTNMLANLDLDDLSVLVYAKPDVWEEFGRMALRPSLKNLSCYFSEATEEDVQSLVPGIIRSFPLLTSLAVSFENHQWSVKEAMQILSRLNEHPNLERIIVYADGTFGDHPRFGEYASYLQQKLMLGSGRPSQIVVEKGNNDHTFQGRLSEW